MPKEETQTPATNGTGAPAFRISAQPIVSTGNREPALRVRDLPRSYGTDVLCLLARDPKNLFAYWDINWNAAFQEESPSPRKVHLRVVDADEAEMALVEVEPLAGTCEVEVPNADSAYRGELGYFQPENVWNRVATSEVVTTPPDSLAEEGMPDFATVPFHLAFQHMIDMIRIAKHENASLTGLLADLRVRATSPETSVDLTPAERDLVSVIESAEILPPPSTSPSPQTTVWTQRKLEQILGVSEASPQGGFGGSSRTA